MGLSDFFRSKRTSDTPSTDPSSPQGDDSARAPAALRSSPQHGGSTAGAAGGLGSPPGAGKTVVAWRNFGGVRCLAFTFPTKLTGADAEAAVGRWTTMLDEAQRPVVLVWDARLMKDYESSARGVWLDTLRATRDRVETIWLVTTSRLVRIGGKALGTLARLDVRVCESLTEIGR